MHAMLLRRYGDPDVLELGEIEPPDLGPADVLVRVHGSSVNPVDASIRAGMLKAFVRLQLPAVLGVDVAGEVVAVGTDVTRFSAGDRVFAYTGIHRGGGYGELATVPEPFVARVPERLDWAEAGTVPGVGTTAYEAFTVHAPVRPGMRVFVNGGAGGVGTYAVQIAKALGAEVTATCSAPKARLLSELGAAEVVDYGSGDPFARGRGSHDVVLNCVRGTSLAALRGLLKEDGVLVTVTGDPLQAAEAKLRNLVSGRKTIVFFVQTSGALLGGLSTMIDRGDVRPIVERTYAWSELPEAHRHVETGRVTGKVAVVPDEMR